ncbi:hypothetical protein QR680_005341 [Steinernema hermaphroditum]|uniref:NTR domain-containing protein n=1 Tax=Steinernema hermaphroditum TaxID=289476 RepID=A0AA39HTW0_9BILA|nr:hypothetical protein QR680_005341 [Steinernema hermaphroditum]
MSVPMLRTLFLLSTVFSATLCCSCRPTSPGNAFCNSDWVGIFQITDKITRMTSMEITYTVNVVKLFRAKYGTPRVGSTATVATPSQSAACGVDWLQKGKQYLLNGSSKQKLDMSLCGQIQAAEWRNVSQNVKNALQTGAYEPCYKQCN